MDIKDLFTVLEILYKIVVMVEDLLKIAEMYS